MLKPISAACAALMLVLVVAAVAAGPAAASQRIDNEAVMLRLIDQTRAERALAPLHVRGAPAGSMRRAAAAPGPSARRSPGA